MQWLIYRVRVLLVTVEREDTRKAEMADKEASEGESGIYHSNGGDAGLRKPREMSELVTSWWGEGGKIKIGPRD
jgi:hypothetical protein